jgi:eukaryotic-like serine/threonine-protein kinase
MGEVYEAEDLELRERVALKIVRPEIAADPRSLERFKREIQLARKVTHPGVCRIFDVFRERGPEGDTIVLSMELLAGETLAERLKRTGRMNTAEALPLVSQMAAALGAAHEAGVVHRDFKPGNVMLVPTARGQRPGVRSEEAKTTTVELPTEQLRAVVTDFGLARSVVRAGDPAATLSATAGIVGTPAYMAPEQVEGGKITAAADIYALGVAMYEMVTGQQPFTGDTPLSTAVKRLKQPPPSPREFVPDLDPRWEQVILRSLDRNPADRFVSATEMVRALTPEGVGRIGVTQGPGAVRKPSLRHRRLSWLVAFIVIAAMAIFALLAGRYYLHLRRSAGGKAPSNSEGAVRARRSVAVMGFKNLGHPEQAWLSTALSEMLSSELAAGEELRTIPGEDVAQTKINLSLPEADSYGKNTLAKLHQNLGADFVLLGSFFDTGKEEGGQVRLDLRLQDATAGETIAVVLETGTEAQLLDLVSRTGAELRQKLGVDELTAADANAVRASAPTNLEAARLYAEGLKRLRVFDALGARDLLERAVAAEPTYPMAHAALAAAWSKLGYDLKAREEAKKAFDLAADLSREDRLSVEARYRETTHEWGKAVELYQRLFDFFPDNLDYGLRMANVQWRAGRGKDALVTIEALRKLPPPARDDPRIDLAEALALAESLGDFKRAQAAAVRAAEKAEALGAPLLVAEARVDQYRALRGRGQYKEAGLACESAQTIYTRAGDRDGAAIALFNGGVARYSQGDLAGAQGTYEEALAVFREVGDERDIGVALNNIAGVVSDRGDHVGAEKRYEQALRIYQEIHRKDDVGLALSNIARELMLMGNLGEANTKFRQALAVFREIGKQDKEAWNLENLGNTLYLEGDLRESDRTLEQSLEICYRIDAKQTCERALSDVGNLLESEGELGQAKAKYQQALDIQNQIGDQFGSAESRLSLAELSIEEGRPREGEVLGRGAREVFRRQKVIDDEIWADAVLARALLAQGKSAEAQKEINASNGTAAKLQNEEVRLKVALAAAPVRAASGKAADNDAATKSLEATLAEATKHGYLGYQFEARLALGEIEMKSGHTTAGRAHLAAVQKEAQVKGFELLARKAARAESNLPGEGI